MAARVVDKATMFPAKCIVTTKDDGPFIDTGVEAVDIEPHIYLHTTLVETWARDLLGMYSAKEVEKLQAQVQELQEKVEEFGKLAEAVETVEKAERELEKVVA